MTEFAELHTLVENLNPTVIVEIGVGEGASAYAWQQLLLGKENVKLILIDEVIPNRKPYDASFITEIEGKSQLSSTLDEVKQALGGLSVDFLFIDGGHSYEEVSRDFNKYSLFVKPQGYVALHDISTGDVKTFWNEIKSFYTIMYEGISERDNLLGTGVLCLL
jgi:cephalosporin hydroxylase